MPAITLHECAHGWTALCLGDSTAQKARRLSLNPIRHIDPIGTLALPGLLLLVHAPFLFGWAKPVPVNFARLRLGRWGIILVAAAGPLSNLFMMFGWLVAADAIGLRHSLSEESPDLPLGLSQQIVFSGIVLNLALMVVNLIPLPPLDGGRIFGALLPRALAVPYMRLERFGLLLMMALTLTGGLRYIIVPVLSFVLAHLGLL